MNEVATTDPVIEGRVLDLRASLRGGSSRPNDPIIRDITKAFERIAKLEEKIDFLVRSRLDMGRDSYDATAPRIADLRTEIRAQYEDMIEKADLQTALRDRGLF